MRDISQYNDTPIQRSTFDLQRTSSAGVVKNIAAAEGVVGEVLQRKQTFLQKIWPNPVQRERAEAELRMVKTEYDVLERTLIIIRESQVQSIQEVFNQFMIQGKAHMREQTFSYLMAKWSDLKEGLDRQFKKLSDDATVEYRRAQEIEHPATRAIALARLDDIAYAFKEFSDQLRKEFENILDEQIRAEPAR